MREYVYFTGHSMYFYGFSVEFISVLCFYVGFLFFLFYRAHTQPWEPEHTVY